MISSKGPIRKAVFPVAGFGTRFLPATKASPKEMLSVVNKPLIQYAVEEAYAAGIRQMIFITSHNKRSIEDHFDSTPELEMTLNAHHKTELVELIHSVKPEDMECCYVRQPKALGLGHAVLCAENLIADEPFAVLLADDLMMGNPPIMKQMVDIYEQVGGNILAVEEVPHERTSQYGIVQGHNESEMILRVQDLVEKPHPNVAPSNTAIAGRYILSPGIFEEIRNLPHKENSEMQLTDGINGLLNKESVFAYRYAGKRYDCGSILGFLKANVALGRLHPTEGEAFSKWLLDQN